MAAGMIAEQGFLFEDPILETASPPEKKTTPAAGDVEPIDPGLHLPAETSGPLEESETRNREWRERPLKASHLLALNRAFAAYSDRLGHTAAVCTYYRYSGLSHTVRWRGKTLLFRISHHFEKEPDRVVEAVGHVLLRKLLRLRPVRKETEICREAENRLLARVAETPTVNRPRPTLHTLHPRGHVHDLKQLLCIVAQEHFGGDHAELPVYWSKKPARRYWGKYYPDPPRIVLNRGLDRPEVPQFVVEAVLHHEMLHHHLGMPVVNGRRRAHTPEFRRLERSFPKYLEAEKFLAHFGRPQRKPSRLAQAFRNTFSSFPSPLKRR